MKIHKNQKINYIKALKRLNYEEIRGIISDVVNYNLDDVQIAFFLASAFKENGFSEEGLSETSSYDKL